MSIGFLFWLVMIIALLFGGLGIYRSEPAGRWYGGGFSIVVWLLLGLLGWAVFGSPLKG